MISKVQEAPAKVDWNRREITMDIEKTMQFILEAQAQFEARMLKSTDEADRRAAEADRRFAQAVTSGATRSGWRSTSCS